MVLDEKRWSKDIEKEVYTKWNTNKTTKRNTNKITKRNTNKTIKRNTNETTKRSINNNIKEYTDKHTKSNINNNVIQFNRYNGRKRYLKLSVIADSHGVPLGSLIVNGKKHDSLTIEDTINSIPIDLRTKRNSTHNRYKQRLLADSAYNSIQNKMNLTKLGYIPIIAYNRRNTKNQEIMAANQLSPKEMEIYKNRRTIESTFAWLKKLPVINQNYQKTIKSFNGMILLASSIIISKNI